MLEVAVGRCVTSGPRPAEQSNGKEIKPFLRRLLRADTVVAAQTFLTPSKAFRSLFRHRGALARRLRIAGPGRVWLKVAGGRNRDGIFIAIPFAMSGWRPIDA